jgi:hypothetical protein
MNRKERRNMESKLGILKIKIKLPFLAWSEEVKKNVESGIQKQEAMKDIRRIQDNDFDNEEVSKQIEYITTDLMDNKGLSFTEAREEARKIYMDEEEGKSVKEEIKNEMI